MKARRRHRKAEASAPAPKKLTWKGKAQIYAAVIGLLAFIVIRHAVHVRHEKRLFAEKLEQELARWQAAYNLDDRQVGIIRQIEFEFHGNGNSLTRPFRSPDEEQLHHQKIAALMAPEEARRFLASRKRH